MAGQVHPGWLNQEESKLCVYERKQRNHLARKRKKKVLEKESGKAAAVIRKTIKMSRLHVELG